MRGTACPVTSGKHSHEMLRGHCEEERRGNPMKETLILLMRLPQRLEPSQVFNISENRFAMKKRRHCETEARRRKNLVNSLKIKLNLNLNL